MRLMILLVAAMVLAGCASESPESAPDADMDTDGDGFPDVLEEKVGSDPFDDQSVPDLTVHEAVSFAGTGMIVAGSEVFGMGCGVHGTVDTFVLLWPIQAPANVTRPHVTDLAFTARLPPTMLELDLHVYAPNGDLLTAPTTMTLPPSDTDTVAIEGKHEVGEYRIEVRGCLGSGEVAVEGTGTLGYTPDMETLLHREAVEHQH